MSDITTEGRIFAKQVWREIKRREPLDATAMMGKPAQEWSEPILRLGELMRKPPDPLTGKASPFTLKTMDAMMARLKAIKDPLHMTHSGPVILTLHASEYHTLTVMVGERETGIIGQIYDCLHGDMRLNVSNVSDHALGNLYDRILAHDKKPPTVRDGCIMVLGCARIGMLVATTTRLINSEIFMNLSHGVVAVGNVKLSANGPDGTDPLPWYDVRTVLPETSRMLDRQHHEQAQLVNDVLMGRATIDAVPYIPMRPDYVMKMLDAARNPQ